MKKLFICAFLVYTASLQAQPMGKGNLPPYSRKKWPKRHNSIPVRVRIFRPCA